MLWLSDLNVPAFISVSYNGEMINNEDKIKCPVLHSTCSCFIIVHIKFITKCGYY